MALVATILFAACARIDRDDSLEEIFFRVASFGSPGTKADDYKDNYASVPFGAYAYFKADNPTDNTNFMINQKIAFNGIDTWSPEGSTYYWPKSGSLDFICYSPYSEDGIDTPLPVITEDSINYPAWDVNSHRDVDILYSDKAVGQTGNANTYYYNGVPVLFHHALSRVGFKVRLAYSEIQPETMDKTKWEVTVNSITLKDILTTGSMGLTLNGTTWDKPNNGIWTSDGSSEDIVLDVSSLGPLTDTEPQTVGESFLVLPQSLEEGQKVILNLTIKTFRDIGSGYVQVLQETDVPIEASLANGSLNKWGMNQSISYTLVLMPSRSTGTGVDSDGDGIDDQVPSEIHFDPAVEGWESVSVNAAINI